MVPEYGRVVLPLSELVGDENGARVAYCCNQAENLSDANSAFHGFYPQIRKYRRSLIEVLLASLVLQLLNLAQPW